VRAVEGRQSESRSHGTESQLEGETQNYHVLFYSVLHPISHLIFLHACLPACVLVPTCISVCMLSYSCVSCSAKLSLLCCAELCNAELCSTLLYSVSYCAYAPSDGRETSLSLSLFSLFPSTAISLTLILSSFLLTSTTV
jgi:hypothetical protein